MASDWYYSHNGERHGPVSSDRLKEMAAAGRLKPDDLVWKEGMDAWAPAAKVKGLLTATAAPAAPARAADPLPVAAVVPARAAEPDGDSSVGMPRDISHRKLAAGLTAIQFGWLGIHKFIRGETTAGLIMLLVSVLSFGVLLWVVAIIGMIEGVKYLRMTDEEFYQTYLVERKAWF
jgi:TM2 domain-containing membrane protein YozV